MLVQVSLRFRIIPFKRYDPVNEHILIVMIYIYIVNIEIYDVSILLLLQIGTFQSLGQRHGVGHLADRLGGLDQARQQLIRYVEAIGYGHARAIGCHAEGG